MPISITASLKLTSTDLEPVLSGFYDGLADDPPTVRINCRRAGTVIWDFHSSATPPASGLGSIGTGTQAVVGGLNTFNLNLSAYVGEEGYLHFRCENADGESNIITSQVITVPSAFTPADLFLSGEKGGFWDINNATAFSDPYLETAASIDGAIGSVADSSGNGNHIVQITSTKRPILKQSGGIYYFETDGSNDEMSVSIDLDDSDECTIFCLQDPLSVANNITVGMPSAYPLFYIAGNTASAASVYALARITSGDTLRQATVSASPLTEPMCVIGEANISANHVQVSANGQTNTSSSTYGTATDWGTSRTVYVSYNNCYARIYAALIINRLLTPGEITSLQSWAKTRGNITW